MRDFLSVLLFASVVVFVSNTQVFASTDTDAAVEEDSTEINEEAATPGGAQAVADRIRKEFDVDEATVNSLRDKKLGYGEISIALSLAERMPGGITEENLDKIISMRQGPPVEGWGNIAKDLKLDLKPAASHLEKIGSKTEKQRADYKKTETKKELLKNEKVVKTEKAERPERVEKVEKPERVERIERPERPERGGRK